MRFVPSFIVLVAIAGCGLARIEEQRARFVEINNGLVGKSYDDLLRTRGIPTRQASLSDGGRIVEYEKSETVTAGGGSVSVPASAYIAHRGGGGTWVHGTTQQAMPVVSRANSCLLGFAISPAGVVEAWKAVGNACY